MSMYSQLLASAWQDRAAAGAGEDLGEMVARLVELRARVGSLTDDPVASDLALQLELDLVLLSLCVQVGLEADPSQFDRPLVGRRKVEEELRRRGIDVGPGGDHRP